MTSCHPADHPSRFETTMAMNVVFLLNADQNVGESAGGVHFYGIRTLCTCSKMSTSVLYMPMRTITARIGHRGLTLGCYLVREGFRRVCGHLVVPHSYSKWQSDSCQKSVSTLLELLFLRPRALVLLASGLNA